MVFWMKLKKIVLSALVSGFLLSVIVGTSVASQPRTVGVTVGDWFKYGVAFDWSSDKPNATIPPDYEQFNKTEWMQLSIMNVSGTNVTSQLLMHFKNGTEQTLEVTTNVDAGEADGGLWIVSANLNPNDTLYTSSSYYYAWMINETTVRTYPDGIRETNHINLTGEEGMTGIIISQNVYWDRSTGVLVEMSTMQTYQTEGYQTNTSLNFTIIDSNVWVIPEFPTFASIFLMLIIPTVAIAFYKRRLLKTPIH